VYALQQRETSTTLVVTCALTFSVCNW
jgi:hypothetical protein